MVLEIGMNTMGRLLDYIQYRFDNKTKWPGEKRLQVLLGVILLILVACYLFMMLPSFKDSYYFGFWIQSSIIIVLFIVIAFYFLRKSLSSQDNNSVMMSNEKNTDSCLQPAIDTSVNKEEMREMMLAADKVINK